MRRKKKPPNPKRVGKWKYDALGRLVSPGQAHQYQAPAIPETVPGASAYTSFAVLGLEIGSTTVPWPSGTKPPRGIAYLGIGFRVVAASPLLRKMDVMWDYCSSDGEYWHFHSKDHPHHHDHLAASTGFYSFIPNWEEPIASGVAKDYLQGSSDMFLSLLRDGLLGGVKPAV